MRDQLDAVVLGRQVHDAREYLELSPAELADMIGIEVPRLLAIESGEEAPEATLLPVFSKALGRGVNYFLGDVDVRVATERAEFLARAAEDLSEDDMGELRRFATYLKSRTEDVHA